MCIFQNTTRCTTNNVFDDSGKLTKYIAENKPDWEVKDGRIFKAAEAQKLEIPSLKLISQSLSYANELERIV